MVTNISQQDERPPRAASNDTRAIKLVTAFKQTTTVCASGRNPTLNSETGATHDSWIKQHYWYFYLRHVFLLAWVQITQALVLKITANIQFFYHRSPRWSTDENVAGSKFHLYVELVWQRKSRAGFYRWENVKSDLLPVRNDEAFAQRGWQIELGNAHRKTKKSGLWVRPVKTLLLSIWWGYKVVPCGHNPRKDYKKKRK